MDRSLICPAAGVSHYQYAEGESRALIAGDLGCEGECALLQRVLYVDGSGCLSSLQECEQRPRNDHGGGEHERFGCL